MTGVVREREPRDVGGNDTIVQGTFVSLPPIEATIGVARDSSVVVPVGGVALKPSWSSVSSAIFVPATVPVRSWPPR